MYLSDKSPNLLLILNPVFKKISVKFRDYKILYAVFLMVDPSAASTCTTNVDDKENEDVNAQVMKDLR